MTSQKLIPHENDICCYCPKCGNLLTMWQVIEGEHKGTVYYNCEVEQGKGIPQPCDFRYIKKDIVHAYQNVINKLKEAL